MTFTNGGRTPTRDLQRDTFIAGPWGARAPRITRNPETSAACQLLYSAADAATPEGREHIFRAIQYLTGRAAGDVRQVWEATR